MARDIEGRKPYYGFSCIALPHELKAIVNHSIGKTNRRLMLGTHMSSKSLRGYPVRRPKRTLQLDQVRGLYSSAFDFKNRDRHFPVIHFNTDGPDIIESEMLHVDRMLHDPSDGREFAIRERLFRGFQLNDALPNPDSLRWFQANHLWQTPYEIILQLGGVALRRADNDSEKLAKIVESYKGTIDYILLDASGGKGLTFDPEWARPYLRAIATACPWVGLGIAGGLGPDTLHLVAPLAEEFPELSIDAESRLRDEQEDNLMHGKVTAYLDRAIKIFEPNYSRE